MIKSLVELNKVVYLCKQNNKDMKNLNYITEQVNTAITQEAIVTISSADNIFYVYTEDNMLVVNPDRFANELNFPLDDCGVNDCINYLNDLMNNQYSYC